MKIGIAGPMTLQLLDFDFTKYQNIPQGYDFPMTALLINAFLKRGHEVVAYTTSVGLKEPVIFKGNKFTICIGRREPHAARDFFYSERKDLVQMMKAYSVDILSAHWTYEFACAALVTSIPTLVTVRDYALKILQLKFDGHRFSRFIMNFLVLNKARFLSTNSEYLFNCLSRRHQSKTRIIPNFYSNQFINFAQNEKSRENFIISVSNGFGKIKNIDTGLKAFSIIKKKLKRVQYFLVGDGMEEDGVAHSFATKNNLTEGVRFLGPQPFEQIISLLKKTKLFLHPSREESFGMAPLEAIIMGAPVLGGSKSGNIPYLLNHGQAGVLCDIESPQAIADGAMKVLLDEKFSNEITKNATIHAKENYSEDVVIDKYLNYFEQILNGKQCID